MNDQFLNAEVNNWPGRIVLGVAVLALIILIWVAGDKILRVSDPYVESVLNQVGDSTRGQAIFMMNCAGCHVQQPGRQVGPNLHDVSQRKSKVRIIKQVTSGETPPMPQFQPTSQEMADLLSYLEKF
ncbi:MAG: cytochrome c [Oscillatoriales cyanobacterium RM1_1_9]|nr:cytochrome c [Oscillatoriales cyanobacterium SM2_3_0]NJO45715.1 cytochrome c [Oscillatoriales cyanobacterium RM2_1_1]NJO70701.1 cytochrome c [Oscillatoriales cyanobacterium RM1_1_9]